MFLDSIKVSIGADADLAYLKCALKLEEAKIAVARLLPINAMQSTVSFGGKWKTERR